MGRKRPRYFSGVLDGIETSSIASTYLARARLKHGWLAPVRAHRTRGRNVKISEMCALEILRKKYESTESTHKDGSAVYHHVRVCLLWTITEGPSGKSGARRRLSQLHNGGRAKRASQSYHRC